MSRSPAGPPPLGRDSDAWRERCGNKLVSARQAIHQVRPGERIFLSAGSAVPRALVRGLVDQDVPLGDNEIVHLLTLGDAPYVRPEFASRFRHNALFIGENVREAVSSGRADYTPIFLSEIPALIRSGRIGIDVAIVSVSPPDAQGMCTLGTHVDIAPAAIDAARLVIAQVNPRMPRTCGPCRLPVDRFHAMVECDEPLPELPPRRERPETEAIARYVADLVPDGATLQLGIGGIPDGVLRSLRDHQDLGIHTEMFSDGVVDLVRRGVITGRRKTLYPGRIIASFVMGSQSTYEFLDQNESVELHPVDVTNDPFIIARNDTMIAINTCLQVDLTGQVCSDSIGSRFYSGIGGQVDFIRGAARSKGGKAILALPSTACSGTVSRIVPRLDDGAGVVTTRGDVHWVVTEFGAVDLHGLNVRQRAMALISIAHPSFRRWLLAEAKRLHFVYADQLEPPVHAAPYPHELETSATTHDGLRLRIRPIKPTDEPLLHEMFYRLSQDSVYRRFFGLRRTLPHESLQHFCTIDYTRDMTLVACIERGSHEQAVAWAGYNLDPETRIAEVALIVDDAYQHRGIGTTLLLLLTRIAKDRGVRGFTAVVQPDNRPMLRVFEKLGYIVQRGAERDLVTVQRTFDDVRNTLDDRGRGSYP